MKKITIFIFVLFLAVRLQAQISPGELTNAHSQLEGMSKCTSCHVLGEQVSNAKCLACHTEINESISSSRGYHGGRGVKGRNCWTCHSEHNGRNFKIIKFDRNSFDHRATGFELTGRHTRLGCNECHRPENIKTAALKKRKSTFMGLSQKCSGCHEDNHLGALGDNCLKCHNTNAFKPVNLFDHNQTVFRLTDSHLKVSCSGCHKSLLINGKKFQKFSAPEFRNCTPCHKDVHQGKLGRDCRKCHETTDFRQAGKKYFDHSKTGYPLTGRHAQLSCNSCHKKEMTADLKYDKCTRCHQDYHKGAFTNAANQRDCSECHTTAFFKPSNYTLEEHNKSRFELKGAHLAVQCSACHVKNSILNFRFASLQCSSCHGNYHQGELKGKFSNANQCEQCHNEESWKVKSFDHKQTGFELKGRHAALNCASCHYENSTRLYRFASLSAQCSNCHKDIHQGQFLKNGAADCGRCHTEEDWKPVKFNHELTRFPLSGGHTKIACASCHPAADSAGTSYRLYKVADARCSYCHRV